MEETQKIDTPQQANPNANSAESAFDSAALKQFGAEATEGSQESNLSVEDAFFGTPKEDNTEEAPQQEQAPPVQEGTTDAKNDERRYQYWQSQAAKRDNEIKALQQELEAAKQTQAAQAPAEPAREEFPPPPVAPKKPHRFSREEAWSDPQSESARYLDEKEAWEADINKYNDMKHQYELALMQEKLDAQNNYLKEQEQQRNMKIEAARQRQQISEHVQGHYGLSPADTQEFIKTMSDPSSISMDNLVQLFKMRQAGANQPQNPTGPSEAFVQSKNAQQIPSPMGVMPSQTEAPISDENSIMDDLIKTHKSKNPWS